jgi:phage terminase large subunit-like protein
VTAVRTYQRTPRHSGSSARLARLARRQPPDTGPGDALPDSTAPRARQWGLHAMQHAFVASPARFSFFVGGIGSGKSYSGAVKAILWVTNHPGSLGLVGAPTYPMLRDVTERTFFERLPETMIRQRNRNEERLTLINGSEILFRSLSEPDRIRGLNLAWFWLDEAPICGYEAWQLLKGRLRQQGFEPAAWATGTPRGRDGYARDFELAPLPHHALFRASTRENAANLPEGYLEDLHYAGQFALQEIEGLFVAFEGLGLRLRRQRQRTFR